MRDRPPMRYHFYSNMALYFYTFVPPMKDHLSYETTLCGSVGGLSLQVSLYMCYIARLD